MEDQRNELFSIRVNETGKYFIRKFAKMVKFAFLITILISIGGVYQFIQLIGSNFSKFITADLSIWTKVQPLIFLISLMLNVYGVLCYQRFSAQIKESIEVKSEENFNKSFRLLFRNATVFVIVLVLNLIMTGTVVISLFQKNL